MRLVSLPPPRDPFFLSRSAMTVPSGDQSSERSPSLQDSSDKLEATVARPRSAVVSSNRYLSWPRSVQPRTRLSHPRGWQRCDSQEATSAIPMEDLIEQTGKARPPQGLRPPRPLFNGGTDAEGGQHLLHGLLASGAQEVLASGFLTALGD